MEIDGTSQDSSDVLQLEDGRIFERSSKVVSVDRGYGRELLSAMIAHAKKEFPHLVVAATVSPLHSKMIHLLRAHGFVDSGESVRLKSVCEQFGCHLDLGG